MSADALETGRAETRGITVTKMAYIVRRGRNNVNKSLIYTRSGPPQPAHKEFEQKRKKLKANLIPI
jgi:hypothetical protein